MKRTTTVTVRVTPRELARFKRAARRAKRRLSVWVRDTLIAAAAVTLSGCIAPRPADRPAIPDAPIVLHVRLVFSNSEAIRLHDRIVDRLLADFRPYGVVFDGNESAAVQMNFADQQGREAPADSNEYMGYAWTWTHGTVNLGDSNGVAWIYVTTCLTRGVPPIQTDDGRVNVIANTAAHELSHILDTDLHATDPHHVRAVGTVWSNWYEDRVYYR